MYDHSEVTTIIRNVFNSNQNTIDKIIVLIGRILKFKNNGLNLKEPCLYENLVMKRIKIIKNFLNETYKFNLIIDQINQIATN